MYDCHHSHAHLHHRLVPPTCQPCQIRCSTYYRGMPMVSATNGTKHLPNIQNYTIVRQDRCQGPGGGFLFFIHNSVSFNRNPQSTKSTNDPHLEELTISIAMDNTELLITNMHIPLASYLPPIDHLLTGTDSLVLTIHSGTTDTRGNELADSISISSFAVPNTDSPTRLPGNADISSPDVSLASAYLIRMANTHNHELRPSAHLHRITDNCHLISCPAQNLHQPQED